jgi:hypothetical protein
MDTTQTSFAGFQTSTASRLHDSPEPFNQTVVFGVLGLLVAIFGIVVAALQLRYMQRKKSVLDIFELA